MSVTNTYTINRENLRELDGYLEVQDPEKYDAEIEKIVDNLWVGIGECEELLRPFFTTYLQSYLLRSLYIHYLSLQRLSSSYEKIVVDASTVVLDIVARHFGTELNPDRSDHDEEFFLVRHYDFSVSGRSRRPWWKRLLLSLGGVCMGPVCRFRGVDVLYLNAGKLDDDLSLIPRAMSALWIPLRPSSRSGCDARAICAQVRENIRSMKLSIPEALVEELVEKRVFAYLPDVLDRIGVLTEFIEKYQVKLVVISAAMHENHLCLLAASRLAGIESLYVTHGFNIGGNFFLDGYLTYQGTLTTYEPQYKGAIQFPVRLNWFERKI